MTCLADLTVTRTVSEELSSGIGSSKTASSALPSLNAARSAHDPPLSLGVIALCSRLAALATADPSPWPPVDKEEDAGVRGTRGELARSSGWVDLILNFVPPSFGKRYGVVLGGCAVFASNEGVSGVDRWRVGPLLIDEKGLWYEVGGIGA